MSDHVSGMRAHNYPRPELFFQIPGAEEALRPYGTGQSKEHWEQFQAHLEFPATPPGGYILPVYRADRIIEYR